jgi:2-oxoglutarate ferredoxin oxidoreductase subunit alpha
MKNKEVMSESHFTGDSEVLVVAFGIVARIALSAVLRLRREGLKIGLFRPITLFPFPEKELLLLSGAQRRFLVMEMNAGQMVEDVRLSVNGMSEVLFYGRPGGAVISPDEVQEQILEVYNHRTPVMKTDLSF